MAIRPVETLEAAAREAMEKALAAQESLKIEEVEMSSWRLKRGQTPGM